MSGMLGRLAMFGFWVCLACVACLALLGHVWYVSYVACLVVWLCSALGVVFGMFGMFDTLAGVIHSRASQLSGGQIKRLQIASRIFGRPVAIFADEPTSGLDAPTAYHVVELLARLARSGLSVVMTIHSPSKQATSTHIGIDACAYEYQVNLVPNPAACTYTSVSMIVAVQFTGDRAGK